MDTEIEVVIKMRLGPCFIFRGTVPGTGLIIVFLRGSDRGAMVTTPVPGPFPLRLTPASVRWLGGHS
ncbi:MAG: hypothetical protein QN120_03270 [Armatimonadota bacterium]|nr:hypothetical protein [Armatimonadota bacterium]